MAFKAASQKFNAAINAVTFGTGDKAVTLGGENVLPFYTFDAPIENKPRVGVMISDLGMSEEVEGISKFYEGASAIAELAKRASEMPGADFVALSLDSADPNGLARSADDCAEECRQAAEAIDLPLVIIGTKNAETNAVLFDKVAAALEGKKAVILSAVEDNYKTVSASAGLAYNQIVGAESSVDINLAKQLNVLVSQMGIKGENVIMNVGTAAAGYGFEYVASTMERIKMAALSQNDNMLQMPIMTPVASESWQVKESLASEDDFPEWGSREERGIHMEIVTAASALACGSNAVILKHPQSVATISAMINELV